MSLTLKNLDLTGFGYFPGCIEQPGETCQVFLHFYFDQFLILIKALLHSSW
jgi:hypothetical protein